MFVYLNGQFVEESEARLSAFDAGTQHAVGLFETMRAYQGCVYRGEQHAQRLADSALELGLTRRMDPAPLLQAVSATLEKNAMTEARIRLTITGGDLALLGAARAGGQAPAHTPTVMIHVTAPTVYPQAVWTDGVPVTIADPKANPFDPHAGHKTLNYWPRLRTLNTAAAQGAAETLWFSVTNHLCGGAVSNAFVVKDGVLLTPIARGEEPDGGLPSAVLPGTRRAAVIEQATALGLEVQRKMLTIQDVLGADELFLTNASWLILPVVRVEKHVIRTGKPGPVTGQLYDAVIRDIEASCPEPA